MAWARSELLLAPPLPLLEEQQQGCAAPASRSMSNSSISRDGILLGVNWPHPAVRAHAASRRLDAPSCSHCQVGSSIVGTAYPWMLGVQTQVLPRHLVHLVGARLVAVFVQTLGLH